MFTNFRLCRLCGWYSADIIIHDHKETDDITKEGEQFYDGTEVGKGSKSANDSVPGELPRETLSVLSKYPNVRQLLARSQKPNPSQQHPPFN